MAKKATDPKSETAKRIQRTEAYAEKVRKMFAQAVNEILAFNKSVPKLDDGVMYSFDGTSQKMQQKVEDLLRQLHSSVTLAIQQGITLEWEQANAECDKLVTSIFGKEALSNPKLNAITDRNKAAMDAFIQRTENGLNLSDRVWKTVRQLREEMEVAMTVAIGEGQSASQMSRKVREYLNDPDLMFRRFRYKDENGKWRRKWKKRIKDEKTGKYKWIDYDRDDYKTGAGVYKSSAKNAMRVTRTETNIAYRRADNERWQQMDFVLGQKIQLSKNHPMRDICDKLQGIYPKDFVFDGWHPQCFCFVTPVLVDEDEMEKMNEAFLDGKEYTPKGKQITEYPDEFKEWVRDNADNIAKSRSRGTEPYFIRNNSYAIDEILNPKQKELTTLEKAKLRHDARTPEQIEAIKNRWAERQHKHELIKKTADNVLKVASDYGEVDYSKLQQFIAAGNLTEMQSETRIVAKQIASIKKQEAALSDLIPDTHGWHKQFSMSELQAVYDAVKAKLDGWSSLTLEEQAKKLQFEIKYVADPSKYKAGAIKYPTWEVSQSAYIKELASVNYKIDYNAQAAILDEIDKWSKAHPKSLKVKSLLDEATSVWTAKADMLTIKEKVAAAKTEMDKRIAEQARRDAKKAAKSSGFDADAYSKARKNAAMWAKDTQEADSKLRDKCGEVWKNATAKEKDGINGYTEEYHNINEPLRGLTYYGPASKTQRGLDRIPHIESIINKSSYDFDMWVQRGDDLVALKKFGLSNYAAASDAEIKALVGKEGVEGAFWSAGVAKGKGFSGEVIFNIYMPRGTKAMYCEPFSYYGHGVNGKKGMNYDDVIKWDGNNKQKEFGSESEILIQRGTKFRVTKVEKGKNGIWYIDLDVIEQNPVPFPYIGGYPFK